MDELIIFNRHKIQTDEIRGALWNDAKMVNFPVQFSQFNLFEAHFDGF